MMNNCKVVVIGAGWWSQTRHLPQLQRHQDVSIVGIIEPNETPRSIMSSSLVDTQTLSKIYQAPVFSSVHEFVESGIDCDGVIICTSHATHLEVGLQMIALKKHILLEKPMTIDIDEAEQLHAAALDYPKYFQINHSANWREQTIKARDLIMEGVIGQVKHIICGMASSLKHLFEDPLSSTWTHLPNGDRSGFGWGQLSHTLAWVLLVSGVQPETVFCFMSTSDITGADLYDSATIKCRDGCLISVTGVATSSPAYSTATGVHGEASLRRGKLIENKIFGTEGMLLYSGDDCDRFSGCLSVSRIDGTRNESFPDLGFLFENVEVDEGVTGVVPEALQSFIDACLGRSYFEGASSHLGLQVVRTLAALYRSALSGKAEAV